MQLAAGGPTHWQVILIDGSAVDVWADSVEGISGPDDVRDYRFCNLMDVDPADQEWFEIVGRAPTNAARVIVTVARFPRPSVVTVNSA